LITSSDLIYAGLDVALFGFLFSVFSPVFVLYGNSSVVLKINTKRGQARKTIRTIAKYLLISLGLFIFAFFAGYAREQTWTGTYLNALQLKDIEALALFFGYLLFLPAAYVIYQTSSKPDHTLADVPIRDESHSLTVGICGLFYGFLMWGQIIRPQTVLTHGIEWSIILAWIGLLLTFKDFKTGKWMDSVEFLLVLMPLWTLVVIGILTNV